MLVRDAGSFIDALAACERINVLVEHATSAEEQKKKLGEELTKRATRHLGQLEEAFEGMGVKAAAASVQRGLKELKDMTYKDLGQANRDIFGRFKDEMDGRKLFFLDDREATLFEASSPPFGPLVDAAFPNAAEDIAEAAKCLALARYTAAVFHLMRAVECAVQVLSEELEIGNVDREWGKLLSDMKDKIEALPKGDKRDEWSACHAHLYHVKQAWRNKTMHPKKTYTPEEAEGVFSAVRVFMQHLATLLPDSVAEMIG